MKKLSILLFFTFFLATAGWANNTVDPNGDPEPQKNNEGITFSLSKSYFSFFNLFQVEEDKTDSLRSNTVAPPLKEETWDFQLFPLWP